MRKSNTRRRALPDHRNTRKAVSKATGRAIAPVPGKLAARSVVPSGTHQPGLTSWLRVRPRLVFHHLARPTIF